MGCICKSDDRWMCWALRYNKPIHIVDFRHEIGLDGGPCQCGCHDEESDDLEHYEGAIEDRARG